MRQPRRAEITLHQLRVFWSVAHADTLTSAAKQLGMAQPSISQQLSRLEAIIGARLFERDSGAMVISAAGASLLPHAEAVLRGMDTLEEGLAQYRDGSLSTVRIAGITSMLRVLLPSAIARTQTRHAGIGFDIQDCAPADILDLMRSQRARIGLLADNSVADDAVDFLRIPLLEDPLLLVTPATLDLDGVTEPEAQLPADRLAVLNSSIQFTFGTQHAKRVEAWYERVLPRHHVFTQCRSFEVALDLVRVGAGVCLAPALSIQSEPGAASGVRLYRTNEPVRRLVALIAPQDRHRPPYGTLIDAMQGVADAARLPSIRPAPPFLQARSAADGEA